MSSRMYPIQCSASVNSNRDVTHPPAGVVHQDIHRAKLFLNFPDQRCAVGFTACVGNHRIHMSWRRLTRNGFKFSTVAGGCDRYTKSCAAQAQRHGPAQSTTSTGDKGHFDMGCHGYRLMARIPCSWYRAPTVTPNGKAAFSRPSCSGVNATFNTPTFSSK